MSFYSTRGGACVTASQAILGGLAKDGGLFVPSMFPQITMIDATPRSPSRISYLGLEAK